MVSEKVKNIIALLFILLIVGCTTPEMQENESLNVDEADNDTSVESEEVQVTTELPEEIPVLPNSTIRAFSETEDFGICLLEEYDPWEWCQEGDENYGEVKAYNYEYEQNANDTVICDFYEQQLESEDYTGVTVDVCSGWGVISLHGTVVDNAGNPKYYFRIIRSSQSGEDGYNIEIYDVTSVNW